ncbi:30S ribosomal protein S6 (rps6) RpsF [Helicobacter heilmannii]|uniref:30S ribosomal protein S6 n=1 Tax=Helicobacter heilmannii TaxID=35817 RepID=UPI00244D8EE2|nr:30S ribosomal protein S6 [Helicobacter heilmannii]GMB93956.1 30S ribosomal protein S6 (rps6) RpsF [Helicobacter heilmannii]
MKHYETMFILKPTLVEEELKSKIAFYQEVITNQRGVIANTLDMGARHLAYEIQKHRRGYYFVIYFQAEPQVVLELERLYRINEDILRFIILKYENKKEQRAWHTLVDRASKKILHAAPEKPHKEAPAEGQEGQGV